MLKRLFKPKNIVDHNQEYWIDSQYNWLIHNFNYAEEIILPTKYFFGDLPKSGHERAEAILNVIKKLMSIEDWPCQLIAQEKDTDPRVSETVILENAPTRPLGSFEFDYTSDGKAIINYAPHLLNDTTNLIATLAHELCHYILLTSNKIRLGDHDEEEHLTDMFAITSGFGLFLANSRFNFSQHTDPYSQGWKITGGGYLNEWEIIYGISKIFSNKPEDVTAIKPYVKPHLYKLLRKAISYNLKTKRT